MFEKFRAGSQKGKNPKLIDMTNSQIQIYALPTHLGMRYFRHPRCRSASGVWKSGNLSDLEIWSPNNIKKKMLVIRMKIRHVQNDGRVLICRTKKVLTIVGGRSSALLRVVDGFFKNLQYR